MNKDLSDLNLALNKLNQTQVGNGISSVIKQISSTIKLDDTVKSSLSSTVQKSTSQPVSVDKRTNINAPNWILNGTNINDLNTQYQNSINSGSLSFCPLQIPYFSSQSKCINCINPKLYFSLKTKSCIQCYNIDLTVHQCKDNQAAKTNYQFVKNKIILPENQTIQNWSKNQGDKLLCPPTLPFFDGTKCINCQKYFNVTNRKCTICQGDYTYNLTTNTCNMQKLYVSNLLAGNSSLIIPQNKTLNDIKLQNDALKLKYQVIQCPPVMPYFNNNQCINCINGTYFNLISKTCGTCQSGYLFNNLTNHCQTKSYISNLNVSNWITSKNISDVLAQIQNLQKNILYQKCAIEKPFSTGKQCIQCNKGQYFDYQLKKCSTCQNGKVFSINLHKCQYKQSNYQTNPQTAPNLIYEGRAKNEWIYYYNKNIQQNPSILDCPLTSPFFDGNTCIICPKQIPYFNLEYKLCQKCQINTVYSSTYHDCLTTDGNIATQVPTLQKMAAGIFA